MAEAQILFKRNANITEPVIKTLTTRKTIVLFDGEDYTDSVPLRSKGVYLNVFYYILSHNLTRLLGYHRWH